MASPNILLHHNDKAHIFKSANEVNLFKLENSISCDKYFFTDGVRLVDFGNVDFSRGGEYWCHLRLRGGGIFDDILDGIMSVFDAILKPLLGPLMNILEVFIFLIKLIIWFGQLLIWGVQFIIFLLEAAAEVPRDFLGTVFAITSSLLLAIPQTIVALIKLGSETFVKYVINGFWGWDRVPNNADDYKGKYWSNNRGKNGKCYVGENGRVPFSVLMGTILMPPIGVFMSEGLTGWFHIFICSLLTLAFYFPGLLYALIMIYS
jgi:uncharacterized membrane protein YqaE (UPF0057 family)